MLKKLKVLVVLISFIFIFVSPASADVIPPGGCSTIGADCCTATNSLVYCDGNLNCQGGKCTDQNFDLFQPNGPAANTNSTSNSSCSDGSILCGEEAINTAIGPIPFGSEQELTGTILGWGVGIAGGIAFLLILYAGFMIMTSSGNPERLKAGQELLTSAIAGVIMLIFAVFVLRVLGVNILQIPGFGK